MTAFARTMRWASVAGVIRNARAISPWSGRRFRAGERNPSFRGQSGMTASEHQAEPIIFDLCVLFIFTGGSFVDARVVNMRCVDLRFRVEREISLCCVEARAPAHSVDGLE